MLNLIIPAMSLLPYKVTYSQILALGQEHSWRAIILHATVHFCPKDSRPSQINPPFSKGAQKS